MVLLLLLTDAVAAFVHNVGKFELIVVVVAVNSTHYRHCCT